MTYRILLQTETHIFHSTDCGLSWRGLHEGLPPQVDFEGALSIVQNSPLELWAAYQRSGVWTYTVTDTLAETSRTPALPHAFTLDAFPNPFNPTTEIRFDLPVAARMELNIYNSLGQLLTTLLDETRAAGAYHVAWDGSNVTSGLYICQFKAGAFSDAKRCCC